MQELMKTNIYDCSNKIIIVGSCLKKMQPQAYESLEKLNLPMFELCLEETHINMAITKLLGMIRAQNITDIIYASVDKSPHCIQLHYIQNEITKLGIKINQKNYVAVNNKLIEISPEVLSLSKNLSKLSELINKN